MDKKLIEITKYELLGKLPNPFIFEDGNEVKTPEDWEKRRKEIYKTAVELHYGTMPPKPEFLDIEPLYLGGKRHLNWYRLTSGTRENPVTFNMCVFKSGLGKKAPAVISGDLCFQYAFDKEYLNTFLDNGIDLVLFNRTEIAPDIAEYNIRKFDKNADEYKLSKEILDGLETGNCGGQLKKAYPEYTFGAIGAWAWGYSRCVDALERLGFTDMECIAFTGHSRGGKTCALAGVYDERAAIVNPNATCSGGYSSYRINIEAKTETGEIKESEPLSNIFFNFPAWLGNGMKDYIGKEETLPFDSHYLKALVAPRILFVSEAASDIMANPVGSYQTTEAASEVFKFLNCEENLYWYFRSGTHFHHIEDITQLVNIIRHVKYGDELNDKFFKLPFEKIEKAYDWKAPEK